jgi:hypothetical protein
MPRETVEAKALRYLADRCLRVRAMNAAVVDATCRGSDATYKLGWDGRGWSCSCPARGTCAHLVALWLVTVPAQVSPSGARR